MANSSKINILGNFILSILSNDSSSSSSKRLFGGIGYLISAGLVTYCTIAGKQAPDILELFIICSVSLLGIDSITNIWNKKKANESKSSEFKQGSQST